MVFVLFALGPRSPAVWAQVTCQAGWEWVRSAQTHLPLNKKDSCGFPALTCGLHSFAEQ